MTEECATVRLTRGMIALADQSIEHARLYANGEVIDPEVARAHIRALASILQTASAVMMALCKELDDEKKKTPLDYPTAP